MAKNLVVEITETERLLHGSIPRKKFLNTRGMAYVAVQKERV